MWTCWWSGRLLDPSSSPSSLWCGQSRSRTLTLSAYPFRVSIALPSLLFKNENTAHWFDYIFIGFIYFQNNFSGSWDGVKTQGTGNLGGGCTWIEGRECRKLLLFRTVQKQTWFACRRIQNIEIRVWRVKKPVFLWLPCAEVACSLTLLLSSCP